MGHLLSLQQHHVRGYESGRASPSAFRKRRLQRSVGSRRNECALFGGTENYDIPLNFCWASNDQTTPIPANREYQLYSSLIPIFDGDLTGPQLRHHLGNAAVIKKETFLSQVKASIKHLNILADDPQNVFFSLNLHGRYVRLCNSTSRVRQRHGSSRSNAHHFSDRCRADLFE